MISLAYAPDPLVDEPIDGWLHRIAAATITTSWRLLSDYEVLRDSAVNPTSPTIRDLGPAQLCRLSEVSGIEADRLTDMTLHRWQSLGLVPHKTGRGHQGSAWARAKIGRFCPDCLEERDGVHRIQWRTVWSFACLRHRRLLSAFDPATPAYGEPIPLTISQRMPGDHHALEAQETIDALLFDPTRQVRSLGVEHSGWQFLSDLGVLTRAVAVLPNFGLTEGHVRELEIRTGADWRPLLDLFPTPSHAASTATRIARAVDSPVLAALATTTAHITLTEPSASKRAETTWWVTEAQRQGTRSRAGKRGISYPLSQLLSPANPQRARGAFLMRFTLTSHDEAGQRLSPIDASKVPSSAWPNVVTRAERDSREIEGVASSAALLMIASDRRTNDVLEALGLAHLRSRITTDWNLSFDDTLEGDATFKQLVALQRELATNPVPIDYDRRRRIFPIATPLGRNTLKRVLRDLNIREAALVPHCISWYIHELLTGNDFLIGRQGIDMFATHRSTYRKWRARWQQEEPRILHEVAEHRLYLNNIDEPVSWQPQLVGTSWVLPPDDGTRLLEDWTETNRPLRQSSREHLVGGPMSLEATVAFGCRGEGRRAARTHEKLQRFSLVAESKSIRAAAASTGMSSSSALSQSIKALEEEVGQDLFDRAGAAVTLTVAGRKLKTLLEREPLFDTASSPKSAPPGHIQQGDLASLIDYAFDNEGGEAATLREALDWFGHVITYGSAVPAATRIGVTPQWLRRQMERLEDAAGVELWERSKKGIRPGVLTPAGRELHRLMQTRTHRTSVIVDTQNLEASDTDEQSGQARQGHGGVPATHARPSIEPDAPPTFEDDGHGQSLATLVHYAYTNEGRDAAALRELLTRFELLVTSVSTADAAAKAGVTDVWLRKQMERLEQSVQVELWQRTERGVRRSALTAAGQELRSLIRSEKSIAIATTSNGPPVAANPGRVGTT